MVAIFALSFPTFVACLDPKPVDNSGDDSASDSGSGSTGGASIFDVRNGDIADGESVTLEGVLVSSPKTRADDTGKSDGFFIQDPRGGAKSGLYVWSQGQFGDELTVEEGDEVTVSGTISEYFDWTELSVDGADSIEVTGTGTLPSPEDLGDGAGVDWDDYESVPVTLSNQTVESVDTYNTGTLSAGINLDDGFVYNDYACRGSFASVTGIVFYQYEAWSVNNRTEAELSGYADPERIEVSVRDIREGGVCGPVQISDAVAVSASWGEDDGKTSVFVQDEGGGEYSGIVVFNAGEFVDVQPGDLVTVSGEVSDYYGLAEVFVGADSGGMGIIEGGGTPVSTDITDAPADWEAYESVLVTVHDLTAVSDMEYGAVFTDKGVYVDNLFYDFDAENGTSWQSVTGPVYFTSYDDVPQYLVEPRSGDDVVE
jgi:predicted extracellular nuclease